jgi:hypothetical protein
MFDFIFLFLCLKNYVYKYNPKLGECIKEIRRETLNKNPSHLHKYKEKKSNVIPDFFKKIRVDTEEEEKYSNIIDDENIKKNIGLLAAKDGLSFKQISSSNLWNLVYLCIKKFNLFIQTHSISNPKNISPESIIPKPSRKRVKKYIN